jgi:hypothetical protein
LTQQALGISEAEDLARSVGALCSGHDAAVVVVALSHLLAEVLMHPVVTDGMSVAAARRWRKHIKRQFLKEVREALAPLDEVTA